jgi:hypothetical protein
VRDTESVSVRSSKEKERKSPCDTNIELDLNVS